MAGGGKIPYLRDTGGYTIFSQGLPVPEGRGGVDVPCVGPAGAGPGRSFPPCTDAELDGGFSPLRSTAATSDPRRRFPSHEERYGVPSLRCRIVGPDVPRLDRRGRWSYDFDLVNFRTGLPAVRVVNVVQWSYGDGFAYISTAPDVTAEDVNSLIEVGDVLIPVRVDGGRAEDALALAYVHGMDNAY